MSPEQVQRLVDERDAWKTLATVREAEVREARGAVAAERARSRAATQTVIECIGARGPESVESAAQRAVSMLDAMRAERDEAREAHRASVAITAAMERLSERERTIIRRRHFDETKATLREIAVDLGVSHERVRQIEARALTRMAAFIRSPIGAACVGQERAA